MCVVRFFSPFKITLYSELKLLCFKITILLMNFLIISFYFMTRVHCVHCVQFEGLKIIWNSYFYFVLLFFIVLNQKYISPFRVRYRSRWKIRMISEMMIWKFCGAFACPPFKEEWYLCLFLFSSHLIAFQKINTKQICTQMSESKVMNNCIRFMNFIMCHLN